MKKLKQLLTKLDNFLTRIGYEMYPELTKHMKK